MTKIFESSKWTGHNETPHRRPATRQSIAYDVFERQKKLSKLASKLGFALFLLIFSAGFFWLGLEIITRAIP